MYTPKTSDVDIAAAAKDTNITISAIIEFFYLFIRDALSLSLFTSLSDPGDGQVVWEKTLHVKIERLDPYGKVYGPLII